MEEEPGGIESRGSQGVEHNRATKHNQHTYTHTQFSEHCLLKRLFYFHWVFKDDISIYVSFFLGYLFSSIMVCCQEAFNKRLPVCCFGSVRSPLALINSGIKRRGTPFPGLRNPGISHYTDNYPFPSYEPYGNRWLFATLSFTGIALCFINLEF